MESSLPNATQSNLDWKKEFLSQEQRLIMSYYAQFYTNTVNSPLPDTLIHSKQYADKESLLREFLCSVLPAGHREANPTPLQRATWHAMAQTIKRLNGMKLQRLVYLISQSKTLKEKDNVLETELSKEMIARKRRQIKTANFIQNLALLGTVVTLSFGSARSDTKEQMAETMVQTAAVAAIAMGANMQKRKHQATLKLLDNTPNF